MSFSDLYKKIPHRQADACLESLPGAFESQPTCPACLPARDRPFRLRDFFDFTELCLSSVTLHSRIELDAGSGFGERFSGFLLYVKFGESRNSRSHSRKRSSSSRCRDRNTSRNSHSRPKAQALSPSTHRPRAVHAARPENETAP